MKKSAFISDVIFTFLISFIFCLCLFRYYRLSLFLAFLLSVLCGGLTACAIFALLRFKRKKFFLKKADETLKDKLLFHFALASDNNVTAFFHDFLSKTQTITKKAKLCLEGEEEIYFLRFHASPVCVDEIFDTARRKSSKRKILLCSKIDEAALSLCRRFDIFVKTGADVFILLKENDALPEKFLGEETPEKKGKRRKQLWFSKSNSRHFFIGGAVLLSTSLLTPFPYYYLVFGSLLFLASILVRIFGYD